MRKHDQSRSSITSSVSSYGGQLKPPSAGGIMGMPSRGSASSNASITRALSPVAMVRLGRIPNSTTANTITRGAFSPAPNTLARAMSPIPGSPRAHQCSIMAHPNGNMSQTHMSSPRPPVLNKVSSTQSLGMSTMSLTAPTTSVQRAVSPMAQKRVVLGGIAPPKGVTLPTQQQLMRDRSPMLNRGRSGDVGGQSWVNTHPLARERSPRPQAPNFPMFSPVKTTPIVTRWTRADGVTGGVLGRLHELEQKMRKQEQVAQASKNDGVPEDGWEIETKEIEEARKFDALRKRGNLNAMDLLNNLQIAEKKARTLDRQKNEAEKRVKELDSDRLTMLDATLNFQREINDLRSKLHHSEGASPDRYSVMGTEYGYDMDSHSEVAILKSKLEKFASSSQENSVLKAAIIERNRVECLRLKQELAEVQQKLYVYEEREELRKELGFSTDLDDEIKLSDLRLRLATLHQSDHRDEHMAEITEIQWRISELTSKDSHCAARPRLISHLNHAVLRSGVKMTFLKKCIKEFHDLKDGAILDEDVMRKLLERCNRGLAEMEKTELPQSDLFAEEESVLKSVTDELSLLFNELHQGHEDYLRLRSELATREENAKSLRAQHFSLIAASTKKDGAISELEAQLENGAGEMGMDATEREYLKNALQMVQMKCALMEEERMKVHRMGAEMYAMPFYAHHSANAAIPPNPLTSFPASQVQGQSIPGFHMDPASMPQFNAFPGVPPKNAKLVAAEAKLKASLDNTLEASQSKMQQMQAEAAQKAAEYAKKEQQLVTEAAELKLEMELLRNRARKTTMKADGEMILRELNKLDC
eukprot:GEMP01015058.1.p1 GENE.GEMP01015058.1~~GEMP01015058.1.p1  ORF type:complete len:816 (+),score=226.62 GEMP01015058.1:206-2653(+)